MFCLIAQIARLVLLFKSEGSEISLETHRRESIDQPWAPSAVQGLGPPLTSNITKEMDLNPTHIS